MGFGLVSSGAIFFFYVFDNVGQLDVQSVCNHFQRVKRRPAFVPLYVTQGRFGDAAFFGQPITADVLPYSFLNKQINYFITKCLGFAYFHDGYHKSS